MREVAPGWDVCFFTKDPRRCLYWSEFGLMKWFLSQFVNFWLKEDVMLVNFNAFLKEVLTKFLVCFGNTPFVGKRCDLPTWDDCIR